MIAPKRGPGIPLPRSIPGLRSSLEDVLRVVLARVDASHATPTTVRQRLHEAGVDASEEWVTDWLRRAVELRERNGR